MIKKDVNEELLKSNKNLMKCHGKANLLKNFPETLSQTIIVKLLFLIVHVVYQYCFSLL